MKRTFAMAMRKNGRHRAFCIPLVIYSTPSANGFFELWMRDGCPGLVSDQTKASGGDKQQWGESRAKRCWADHQAINKGMRKLASIKYKREIGE